MYRKKGAPKKTMAILLALTLFVGGAIGGTIAWLTSNTGTVTNTFTVGDIEITLAETTGNQYDFVPGDTLTKDPKVTVTGGSEACYVFIKVVEDNNITVTGPNGKTENAMQYAIDPVWKSVPGHDGYWYCEVAQSDSNTVKSILVDNQVKVSPYVPKDSDLEDEEFTLSFTAAAIQSAHIADVTEAFNNLPASFKP